MTRSEKIKILVIDDDQQLLREVRVHLEKLGYEVSTGEDGFTALKLTQTLSPDLIVLDINFPDSMESRNQSLDGVEVLRRVRESSNVPVLMLSITTVSTIKVMALSMGADDYLSKPFDMQELSARIESILRRSRPKMPREQVLRFRRLCLDPGERRVWKDDQPIELTGIEFDILYTMAQKPEHVFTRDYLIERAWKDNRYCVPKAVDVHIGHIRKKIEDHPSNPIFIVTVRSVGYRFEDAVE